MKQQGFTLVELLTVMLLLVAMATITVKSVGQFSFDSRYQITADRYDKIKTAILGNPNQTINGHPSVSGFVADMGRLPNCLRELIDGQCTTNGGATSQIGHCLDGTNADKETCKNNGYAWEYTIPVQPSSHCEDTAYNNRLDCETATKKWITGSCYKPSTKEFDDTKKIQVDCNTASYVWTEYVSFSYGWKGAYIATANNPNEINAFADGWGRPAQGICDNNSNNSADYAKNLHSNYTECQNRFNPATGSGIISGYCKRSDGLISTDANYVDCANHGNTWIDDNYGWYFNQTKAIPNSLTIMSYGKDYIYDDYPNNALPAEQYDRDYPSNPSPAIVSSDWKTATKTVNVTLTPISNIIYTAPIIERPNVEPNCSDSGGTFVDANTPKCAMPLEYNKNGCEHTKVGGSWSTYCSKVYVQSWWSCKKLGGVWDNQKCLLSSATSICLEIRQQNNTIKTVAINPIVENGNTQIVTFQLPDTLPMGQVAFRIITDCVSVNPITYPTAGRDFKIVDILPNRSLNFDW